MTDLIILGGGGHARVLVEALRCGGSTIAGFVTNDREPATGIMQALPRLGNDTTLLARDPASVLLVNGSGTVGNPSRRRSIYDKFHQAGFAFATVVHPSAILASDVVLAAGAQIMAGCVLQPGVQIGVNAIINTGAVIDHDCVIGDHAHVAPGACLAGDVMIGPSAHIGTGARVIQGIRIGEAALVAAGAVVVTNVAAGATVMGVPARPHSSL